MNLTENKYITKLFYPCSSTTMISLVLSIATLLTIYIFFPLRHAGFWIIDDHELVTFAQHLQNSDEGFWQSVLNQILTTEVGKFPDFGRFRPGYYFFRVLQASLFGYHASYWFALNMLAFFTGICALGFAVARFFPCLLVLTAMTVMASFPFNADLWARLGPSETGAFCFSMLFLLGLSRLDLHQKWAWPLCCISLALAISYKENFILFLLPMGIAFLFLIHKKRCSAWTIILLLLPIAATIPILILFYKIFMGNTSHIYLQEVSSQGIIHNFILYITGYHFIYYICCGSALLCFPHIAKNTQISQKIIRKVTIICLGCLLCITLLSLGNFIFYQGNILSFSRYAFPYSTFLLFGSLCALYPYIIFLKNAQFRYLFIFICISALLCFVHIQHIIVKKNTFQALRIAEFQKILELSKSYQRVVLLNSGLPGASYEPYFSLKYFSKAGLTSPEVLYFPLFYTLPENSPGTKVEKHLKTMLAEQKPVHIDEDALLVHPYPTPQRIEFVHDKRQAQHIATFPPVERATTLDMGNRTLLLPMTNPIYQGILLEGDFSKNIMEQRFTVNGVPIAPNSLRRTPTSLFIPVSPEIRQRAQRPDLHTLEIHTSKPQAVTNSGSINALTIVR